MTATHDGDLVGRWLLEAAHRIALDADRLCALDAALGDGDHGTNMARGFGAVATLVEGHPDGVAPGVVLTEAGRTLISTIGGASGALWGFAFRRAGRAVGDVGEVGVTELAVLLDAMVTAVVELGEAALGDKTMLDALVPAARAFRDEADHGSTAACAARVAAGAARDGAAATAGMVARVGRASFLGERSLGHEDPSANSVVIVLEALSAVIGVDT